MGKVKHKRKGPNLSISDEECWQKGSTKILKICMFSKAAKLEHSICY